MINQNVLYKRIFYISTIIAIGIFVVSVFLTDGYSGKLYLSTFTTNTFDDFYTMLRANNTLVQETRYDGATIYPPLANGIFLVINKLLPVDIRLALLEGNSYNMRLQQESLMLFVVFALASTVLFALVCHSMKEGTTSEKNLFVLIILCSIPLLKQYEHMNIIILALLGTLIFLMWKDSENKFLRECALVALALAAGIKIYPAVFGALLLKEHRFKEAVRLVIYGILSVILPCFLFGGVDTIKKLITNLFSASFTFSESRRGYQIGYESILKELVEPYGEIGLVIKRVIIVSIMVLGILSIFYLKSYWKTIVLMCCMCIGVPSISYAYTAIFIIPAILFLLDTKEENRKFDLIYLILLILVIVPTPFCWLEGKDIVRYGSMYLAMPFKVQSGSILLMSLLLSIEGTVTFIRVRCEKSRRIVRGVLVTLFLIGVIILQCNNYIGKPYNATNYNRFAANSIVNLSNTSIVEQTFIAKEENLDYILLKIGSVPDDIFTIAITNTETGKIICEEEYDLAEVTPFAINQFLFDDVKLSKGDKYKVSFYNSSAEKVVQIYRTENTYSTDEEYAVVDGVIQDYCLAINFYEH